MTAGAVVTGVSVYAAAYDRQSREREDASNASPATQRKANEKRAEELREQIEREGGTFRFVGHFSEAPGTSAYGTAARPEFERLLNECRLGRVNMIIVYDVSRFSRLDIMDAIPIVIELMTLGVTLVSVHDGEFRRGNLMDLIHIIMRLEQSHKESAIKSLKVRDTKSLQRELGGYVGGRAPYGFKLVNETVTRGGRERFVIQKLEHDDTPLPGPLATEPDVIRWVVGEIEKYKDAPIGRNKYHPGSISGLCRRLEADGVPTRGTTAKWRNGNSRWDPNVLKRILQDPRIAGYAAEVVYARKEDGTPTRRFSHYRIQRDPVTLRPVELECGPIIEPVRWHALQQWLSKRGRGKGQYHGQSLLSALGVLYCECGSTMGSHSPSNRNGVRTYACIRPKQPGLYPAHCSISQQPLDQYVAGAIASRIRAAEGDEETMAILHEAARRFGKVTEAPEVSNERAALVAERADTLQALEELYEDRAAGAYKGDVGRKHFLKAESTLQLRLSGVEERLRELEEASSPTLPIHEWFPDDPDVDPIGPGSWWDRATIDDRRALIKLFVDKIIVRKVGRGAGRGFPPAKRVVIEFAKPSDDEGEDPTETA